MCAATSWSTSFTCASCARSPVRSRRDQSWHATANMPGPTVSSHRGPSASVPASSVTAGSSAAAASTSSGEGNRGDHSDPGSSGTTDVGSWVSRPDMAHRTSPGGRPSAGAGAAAGSDATGLRRSLLSSTRCGGPATPPTAATDDSEEAGAGVYERHGSGRERQDDGRVIGRRRDAWRCPGSSSGGQALRPGPGHHQGRGRRGRLGVRRGGGRGGVSPSPALPGSDSPVALPQGPRRCLSCHRRWKWWPLPSRARPVRGDPAPPRESPRSGGVRWADGCRADGEGGTWPASREGRPGRRNGAVRACGIAGGRSPVVAAVVAVVPRIALVQGCQPRREPQLRAGMEHHERTALVPRNA